VEVHNDIFRPVSDNHKEASFLFLDAIANQCRNPGVSALNSVSSSLLLRERKWTFLGRITQGLFNSANTNSVEAFKMIFVTAFNAILGILDRAPQRAHRLEAGKEGLTLPFSPSCLLSFAPLNLKSPRR
jgi:hypothetical protein